MDILITAIAIKLYELKNGKNPDSLQELVPTYLEVLPEDPFDNFKPLKYLKKEKGWSIYSFGPNKKDNQASVEYGNDDYKLDAPGDIVFNSSV